MLDNNYVNAAEMYEVVIADKGATRVIAALRNFGVNLVETQNLVADLHYAGAGLRCISNLVHSPVLPADLLLYNRMELLEKFLPALDS